MSGTKTKYTFIQSKIGREKKSSSQSVKMTILCSRYIIMSCTLQNDTIQYNSAMLRQCLCIWSSNHNFCVFLCYTLFILGCMTYMGFCFTPLPPPPSTSSSLSISISSMHFSFHFKEMAVSRSVGLSVAKKPFNHLRMTAERAPTLTHAQYTYSFVYR